MSLKLTKLVRFSYSGRVKLKGIISFSTLSGLTTFKMQVSPMVSSTSLDLTAMH